MCRLTCLLPAGWHYLPNLKDVAAVVPLPNFIFAGEVKMTLGGRWGSQACLSSAAFQLPLLQHHAAGEVPVNLLSPQHHAALQLNP